MPQKRGGKPGAALTDERFISFAPNLEDVLLWRALSGEAGTNGYYIDLGAPDPGGPSVTRAFYERGWHGLDVAYTPETEALLREARPRNRVTTPTLLAVDWQAAGPVHFLRIGSAAPLPLAGINRDRPWIVLVEVSIPAGVGTRPEWEPSLLASGYSLVWSEGLSRFYLLAAEKREAKVAQHFSVQPKLLDGHTVFDARLAQQLARELAKTTASLHSLQSELAELRRTPSPSTSAPDPHISAPSPTPAVATPLLAPPAIVLPLTRNRLGRRIGKGLYRLVRPVARPLAWRGRQFIIGEIQAELAGLRERLDQLVARPIPGAGGDSVLLAATLERVLLTLAVLDAQDPSPPGLAPEPDPVVSCV